MLKVLVTGANGFVGRNLCAELARRDDVELYRHDLAQTPAELEAALAVADVIFHLAGVNRPLDPADFARGNADFTQQICDRLLALKRSPLIVLSSSIQAELENPYGTSKRQAEKTIEAYAQSCAASPQNSAPLRLCASALNAPSPLPTMPRHSLSATAGAHCPLPTDPPSPPDHSPLTTPHSPLTTHHSPPDHSPLPTPHSPLPTPHSPLHAIIYRLPNVFGKWSRPNYNSAVATWCYNIARNEPIQVRDPAATVTLVYIDDVIQAFLTHLSSASLPLCVKDDPASPRSISPCYTRTLGEITELLTGFKASRETLQVPDLADDFAKKLYATYLSFLPEDQFSYPLKMNTDPRGSFTEFLKTPERGQVSVNIAKPGIVKGNHWHHTKVEKFLVVSGSGVIRFRKVDGGRGTGDGERETGGVVSGELSSGELSSGELSSGEDRSAMIIEYFVSGEKLEVIDIPPGYTHNIENVGTSDLVTVMWANEAFDPEKPDTFFEKV